MAESKVTMADGESVQLIQGANSPIPGAAGIEAHLPGQAATVSEAANSTGGIDAGTFIQRDVDDQLFRFRSDDTPLMSLMLKAKRVAVNSPEVEHFQIDDPKSSIETTDAIAAGGQQAALPLSPSDAQLPQPYTTLLVKGVDGYKPDGTTVTPGKCLMLFVTGKDATGAPIVRALNGKKTSPSDEYCTLPAIPKYTTMVILANAMAETQKWVSPDLIVPAGTTVYLQKRGMNQIISDYFDSQKKRIPFTKAILAEQAIATFKNKSNRTLWASRASRIKVDNDKTGMEYVYTTEGVRYQFRREIDHSGKWDIESLIGMAKLYYTGEDVPQNGLLLAGKNLMEGLQTIDYSKHPEVKIMPCDAKYGEVAWQVVRIATVFGTIDLKHEPTLDRIGWSNSGALIDPSRLVHYVRTTEHSFNEGVEGHEATRNGLIQWDALALKGGCHIWIDGEGEGNASPINFMFWNKTTAPSTAECPDGMIVYLTVDCPGINANAKAGQLWVRESTTWSEYTGPLYING